MALLRFGKRRGITGLETAIILIAFVIVASIFAFTVLNVGLTVTQKSQGTVTGGMKQASSALQISGSVIAYDKGYYNGTAFVTTADDHVPDKAETIDIIIKLSPGQEPIDINKTIITFVSNKVYDEDITSATNITWINGDGDTLLESEEECKIRVHLAAIDFNNAPLGPNEWFKIEIKPPVGAVLAVERTIPPAISEVMDLG